MIGPQSSATPVVAGGQIWLSVGHNIIQCEPKVLREKPFHSVQHIYMAASLVQRAQPAGVGGEGGESNLFTHVCAAEIDWDWLTSHDWANVAEQQLPTAEQRE